MKRNVVGALMTLIVAIAIAAPMVQAQSQTIMKAEVPFGFNVGSTYMPAGSYEVRALGARATVIETKDGHNRSAGAVQLCRSVQSCRRDQAGIPEVRRPLRPGTDLD